MRIVKAVCCALVATVLIGTGCRSRTPEEVEARRALAASRAAAKVPPVGSRFARVTEAMHMTEVSAAIGDADSTSGHLMGKNFNPFYFGKDRYRTTWFYRGQGRIVFNMNARVMRVYYDPSETGGGGK